MGKGLLAVVLFPALVIADGMTAGKTAYTHGDLDGAIQEFKKAVQRDQRDSHAYLWLARAIGRKAQKLGAVVAGFLVKDVRHYLERAVEVDPNNVEAREDLLEFYLEAPGILGGGLDKARAQAQAIRRAHLADGLQAEARIAEKQKDYAHAEEHLRAALAADPANPYRYRQLGRFLSRRGRLTEMEAAFRHADDPIARYCLAEACLTHGWKVEDVEPLLKSFLAAPAPAPGEEPTHADAHLLLGKAYVRLGRKNEALGEFRAALAENPGLDEARSEIARLK